MKKLVVFLVLACALPCLASSDGPDTKTTNKVSADAPYVIGVDDVLSISVWKDQELTRTLPVRPDGYITLPLIGDIMANGQTSAQLRDEISNRLRKYMNDPVVTVTVQEIRSRHINVVGEIMKPGTFPMVNSMNVIDAIALAGGFKEFARTSKIYVLRQNDDGTTQRIAFDYKHAIRGNGKVLALQAHDTVVVP